MATATLHSLRDRMTPPAARRPGPIDTEGRSGAAVRKSEVERVLHLATDLFGAATAALVLSGPGGPKVEALCNGTEWSAEEAVDAAHRLFEILATSKPGESGSRAGVMEELAPGRGFRAATPILSASGRCLGAICLMDGSRRTLLTRLQRRLLAEFGDLVAPALGAPVASSSAEVALDSAARLHEIADADPEAFALFDIEGRCLLRNARFDSLLGTGEPRSASWQLPPEAKGCEASWIALHLARDVPPVGVYRAALADGTWLTVEERRWPQGRSLLARVEARDAFGGSGDMQLLFERCPCPMFVFDRDSRAILAVNAAALDLYGWDRDAFLRLDLDGIGPVGQDVGPARGWTHRTRDGRPLSVTGRTIGLDHRGRPAVLVTVMTEPAAA
ncbi:MAG: PAS domain-containing protein [Janthinobacterium lividum]